MRYFEDLLTQLSGSYLFDTEDSKMIMSLRLRVEDEIPLTTRQAAAFMRIIGNKHADLSKQYKELDDYLINGVWKRELVPSRNIVPEAFLVSGNVVAVRCSTSPKVRAALKAMDSKYSNGVNLITVLNKKRLDLLVGFLGHEGFTLDPLLEEYLASAMFADDYDSKIYMSGDEVVFELPNNPMMAEFCNKILGLEDE